MVRALAAAALAVAAFGASTVQAAPQTVGVGDFAFTPASVTVFPGDAVTWRWNGPDRNHSVTPESGFSEPTDSDPGDPFPNHPVGFTYTYTFANPGTFRYFCKVHPSMRGTVVVAATTPTDPPNPADPPDDTTRPRIGSLRMTPARFCKRHRRCEKPGARIGFLLSERAIVKARVSGRSSTGRRVVENYRYGWREAGRNTIRFSGNRLRPGLYRMVVTARDRAGNPGRASVRFRVVPPPPPS